MVWTNVTAVTFAPKTTICNIHQFVVRRTPMRVRLCVCVFVWFNSENVSCIQVSCYEPEGLLELQAGKQTLFGSD